MSTNSNYRPEGYHSVTPYLVIEDADRALGFYARAFGAKLVFRMDRPDGRVAHAEIQIGDSRIMLSEAAPEWETKGPKAFGGTPVSLMMYVPDCDAVFNGAVAAGASVVQPMQDQFYGDRSGTVVDPFGHKWHVATNKETVSPEELQRRAAELFGKK